MGRQTTAHNDQTEWTSPLEGFLEEGAVNLALKEESGGTERYSRHLIGRTREWGKSGKLCAAGAGVGMVGGTNGRARLKSDNRTLVPDQGAAQREGRTSPHPDCSQVWPDRPVSWWLISSIICVFNLNVRGQFDFQVHCPLPTPSFTHPTSFPA